MLLALPVSRTDPSGLPWLTALFTATSAVCVTGLAVVDTPTYWSPFGQGVIMALFQIGGFGMMTGATLLSLLVTRRLGLGSRLRAQAETRSLSLGEVGGVLRLIFIVTLAVEALTTAILTFVMHETYGFAWPEALWHGAFQAVSAFNNAGFSTFSDSLMGFALDPLIVLPICFAIMIGGLGFPVIHEVRRRGLRTAHWSVHTKITVYGTLALLAVGTGLTLLFEWANTGTIGGMESGGKLLSAFVHSVMSRTAGFNSVDIGAMNTETLAMTYALMFIGGGSAGTAGGIKITTFFLLGFIVWAEVRGRADVNVAGRRISRKTQREALAVVLLSTMLVAVATLILLSITDFPLERVLFETVSAFATVGLSTGITGSLPPEGQLVIVLLMFIGRVGTITFATALALSDRQTSYRYPEERPIVG